MCSTCNAEELSLKDDVIGALLYYSPEQKILFVFYYRPKPPSPSISILRTCIYWLAYFQLQYVKNLSLIDSEFETNPPPHPADYKLYKRLNIRASPIQNIISTKTSFSLRHTAE